MVMNHDQRKNINGKTKSPKSEDHTLLLLAPDEVEVFSIWVPDRLSISKAPSEAFVWVSSAVTFVVGSTEACEVVLSDAGGVSILISKVPSESKESKGIPNIKATPIWRTRQVFKKSIMTCWMRGSTQTECFTAPPKAS